MSESNAADEHSLYIHAINCNKDDKALASMQPEGEFIKPDNYVNLTASKTLIRYQLNLYFHF